MAVKILDNISVVQAVPAVTSEIFRDVSKSLSFYIVGAGTAPTWSATITLYEIDKVGYKKTGKSVSFAVSNSYEIY